jgi:hypothetical protein
MHLAYHQQRTTLVGAMVIQLAVEVELSTLTNHGSEHSMFHSLRMRLAMWYRNKLRDLLQSPIVDRPAYSTGWKDGYTVGQTAGWRQGYYDACLNANQAVKQRPVKQSQGTT